GVGGGGGGGVGGGAPPGRRPLGPHERDGVLTLLRAIDLAQQTDVASDAGIAWASHVLKSPDSLAYIPFRVTLDHPGDMKSAAMYVRAVSRHDGMRSAQERSFVRDWLLQGTAVMPRNAETVPIRPGEIPVRGPAVMSSRPSTAAAAQASAAAAVGRRE